MPPDTIQIFSHKHANCHTWQSNFERQDFWPTRAKCWSTDQFITQLRQIFLEHSSQYQINFDSYNKDQNGYYLVFYGNSQQITEHHGLAFLTPDIVERCNQGNLKLLIAFTHETFDCEVNLNQWFWSFSNNLTILGIKKSHSVVVLLSTKLYNSAQFDARCEYLYYPWFEAAFKSLLIKNNRTAPRIDFDKKNKHYISLNRAARPHRLLIVLYLLYCNITQHGHVSWGNPDSKSWKEILGYNRFECHQPWLQQFEQLRLRDPGFPDFVNSVDPLKSINLDLVDGCLGSTVDQTWLGAEQHYQSAYADLVSETHYELHGNAFLTEKTFKPMAYGAPFMFNAGQNHLRAVKELGYQSFPELFNEQYDTMNWDLDKLAVIGNELKLFCQDDNKINSIKNSPEILEKLQFNQNLFWNKNHAQALGDILYTAWHKV